MSEQLTTLLGVTGALILFYSILLFAHILFNGIANDRRSPTVDIVTDYPGGVLFYVTSSKWLHWNDLKPPILTKEYEATELETVRYGTFNHKRLYRWNVNAKIKCELHNEWYARAASKNALWFFVKYQNGK